LVSEHVGPGQVKVKVDDFLKEINDITVCFFDYEKVASADEIPPEGLTVSSDVSVEDKEVVLECYEDYMTFLARRGDKSVLKLEIEYPDVTRVDVLRTQAFLGKDEIGPGSRNRSVSNQDWVLLPSRDGAKPPKSIVAYRAKGSKANITIKSRVEDYDRVRELPEVPRDGYIIETDQSPTLNEVLLALYSGGGSRQGVEYISSKGTRTSVSFKLADGSRPTFLNDKKMKGEKFGVMQCLHPNAPLILYPRQKECQETSSSTKVILYRRKNSSLNVTIKSRFEDYDSYPQDTIQSDESYSIQVENRCSPDDLVVAVYGKSGLEPALLKPVFTCVDRSSAKPTHFNAVPECGTKYSTDTLSGKAADFVPCNCLDGCSLTSHGLRVSIDPSSAPVEKIVVYAKRGSGVVPKIEKEKCAVKW